MPKSRKRRGAVEKAKRTRRLAQGTTHPDDFLGGYFGFRDDEELHLALSARPGWSRNETIAELGGGLWEFLPGRPDDNTAGPAISVDDDGTYAVEAPTVDGRLSPGTTLHYETRDALLEDIARIEAWRYPHDAPPARS